MEQIYDLLHHNPDHFNESLIGVVQLPDHVGRLFTLVPHVGHHTADSVCHLAHAEVLFDQRLFLILLDQIQFDNQELILLLFVVLKGVHSHTVQFALEEKIQVRHLQLMLLQSALHLAIYAENILQKVVEHEFEMHSLAAFLHKIAE